jgi:HPr kinase/phosphorylase
MMTTLALPQFDEPTPQGASWHGYAFGIGLESELPFPGIQPTAEPAARMTSWREIDSEKVEDAWELGDGELLFERRHPDGRLFLRVDGQGPLGYRMWAPYYGRHLVSADGHAIASALPRVPPVRWQRLFFAQVLPLAAALHGLTLFQASAVAVDGRVLVFVGAAGSGKTSLTAHLVALGASFVTDEVLALESGGSTVLAHPGPSRLSLHETELRRIPSTQELRVGPCVGRSDKLMFEPEPVATALPVARLYVLRPEPGAARIWIKPLEEPAGRSLRGSSFVNYLHTSLKRDPEICAVLDETVTTYDLGFPSGTRARDLAARVLAHRG